MAIILCPECEGKVSNLSTSCPHCGYPILTSSTRNTEIEQTEITDMIKHLLEKMIKRSNTPLASRGLVLGCVAELDNIVKEKSL